MGRCEKKARPGQGLWMILNILTFLPTGEGGGRRGGEEEEERGRGQKAEDKGGEEEKARLIPAKLISLITPEKTPAAAF